MSVLSAPHFHNEKAAYAYVEARVWPDGPVCPHCGGYERIGLMGGKSTRIGAYKCYQCRNKFTVKVGTVFESSHVKLHLWLQAVALLTSSKKRMSSNQLSRVLGVTLKTAWFMSHRVREAMRDGSLAPMGGNGGIVEMDETYHGKVATPRDVTTSGRPYTKSGKSGPSNKRAIVSLVERGGKVRSFHVEHADKSTINKIATENLAREARVHTDESVIYSWMTSTYEHALVTHKLGQYVNADVTTNSIEGAFSHFRRTMVGTYHKADPAHLDRYLQMFAFRWNSRKETDANRVNKLLRATNGRRLTYKRLTQREQ